MAESVLPASLENLKIDTKDDVCRSKVKLTLPSSLSAQANPFTYIGGVGKKPHRYSDPGSRCPLSLFGKKCSKLRSDSANCDCNRYVPSIPKHLVGIRQRPVFKKSALLRQSKLNFVKFTYASKQCDKNTDEMPTFPRRARRNTWSSTNSNTEDLLTNKDTTSPLNNSHNAGLLFGNHVTNEQDFHSLISSTEKQLPGSNEFQSKSFRSLQFLPAKRFHRRSQKGKRKNKDDDDADGVDKVSTKLAAAGISSATCSQQARLTANAYCDEHDISIDELAGYFEDFVHIPKKMSLMAEQMYN